jgi:DUF4097 and DUF4098 domain-containing protein YvlB
MTTATEETVSQQFEVGPGAELTVSNVSGRTDIRAGDGSEIRVRALKHGKGQAVENTEVEMTQDGSHVFVRVKPRDEGFLKLHRNVCAVDLDIETPRDCAVNSRAVSADTSVSGPHADLRLETVSGDVRIEDLAGSCTVSSVSGRVDARSIEGSLKLNTTSGSVVIRQSRLPELNCHSVSGNLTIDTPLATGGHYLARTVSGDLRLLIPSGTGATVQMHTVSGRVTSDVPAEIIRSGRRNWQGRINGGGANVEMHTVSGDLVISLSDQIADSSGSTVGSDPEARARETAAILEALERGEITVDDATSQLKALR